MTIEHTEPISTGIYVDPGKIKVTGADMGPAILAWATKLTGERARFFEWLETGASDAQAVANDEREDSQTRDDASGIHGYLLSLRSHLPDGDAKEVAWQAFHLGRLYERVGVRPFEAMVRKAKKTRETSRRGHEAKHGTKDEKRTRWARYQDGVDSEQASGCPSYAEACRRVAKIEGVHLNTIITHPKKPTN